MWDFDSIWVNENIIFSLLKTFIDNNGQIFQGNTTPIEDLVDAKYHPEKYDIQKMIQKITWVAATQRYDNQSREFVLDKQVRLGRPKNILNLPDKLCGASYSTCIGLLLFALNYTERKPGKVVNKPVRNGESGLGKVFSWLKQNF